MGYKNIVIEKYLNKVIRGNCLEVMQRIPDESVDVTFADPPFNLMGWAWIIRKDESNL
jgi:DNA modification methylase